MTTCQIPPELTEDELSALIDGEADERSQAHILRCPHCAGRLARAREIEGWLRMTLYRRDCPSSLEMAQYQMGLLDTPEDSARIETHLQNCPHCREDLRDWAHFIQEDDAMLDLPAPTGKIMTLPVQKSDRIVLFPQILPEARSGVRGDARVNRVIATADSTMIRLTFEPLVDHRVKMTIQLSSPDVDWREGMINVQQGGMTVAVCKINAYYSGTCELPQTAPVSLRFVAGDETLIEFNDISL